MIAPRTPAPEEHVIERVIIVFHMNNGEILRVPLGNKKPLALRFAVAEVKEFFEKIRRLPDGCAWFRLEGRAPVTCIVVAGVSFVELEEATAEDNAPT